LYKLQYQKNNNNHNSIIHIQASINKGTARIYIILLKLYITHTMYIYKVLKYTCFADSVDNTHR